ncbi:hypothetical protein KAR91_71070 [Candidatus Pacearchaeota archaeon]|nr:hypothetical protein [Candidatus Pacearchaeota archaeon]
MNKAVYESLVAAQEYCAVEDKSAGFMIQYLQDFADVNLSTVLGFLNGKYDFLKEVA